MSEFQVGDHVRVNNPALSTHNDEGVVAAYRDDSAFPYHVQLGTASTEYLAGFVASELEHVRQFKVGDLVKVRDDGSFQAGLVGLIALIVEDNQPYIYKVESPIFTSYFAEDELEPRGFQVGDRVRVRPGGGDWFLNGLADREGIVTEILDDATAYNGWTVEVRLDDAEWTDIFAPTELEFIEEGEPETLACDCDYCAPDCDKWEDTDDGEGSVPPFPFVEGNPFSLDHVDPVRSEALKRALEYVSEWRDVDVIEVARDFELYLRGR